jgi:predicted nuclease of predicted toxin-antitoxin system
MRLIIDENISWRLKKLLPQWEILPANEIKYNVRLTDLEIWRFAKSKSYAILTFDEDFFDLQNLFSYPPKIIWLRTGNVNTKKIASILIDRYDDLIVFLENDELGIYEIHL